MTAPESFRAARRLAHSQAIYCLLLDVVTPSVCGGVRYVGQLSAHSKIIPVALQYVTGMLIDTGTRANCFLTTCNNIGVENEDESCQCHDATSPGVDNLDSSTTVELARSGQTKATIDRNSECKYCCCGVCRTRFRERTQ